MFQSILLRVIPVLYVLCTVALSSDDPDIFSTSIPTDSACTLYNTRFSVEPQLGEALRKVYGKEPAVMTYDDYLRNAQAYYLEEYPALSQDPSYAFDVSETPVACFSLVRDIANKGTVVAMAVPSLRGGSWGHYKEIGLDTRFENIEGSSPPRANVFCLPVKVSASENFLAYLGKDKQAKAAFNRAVSIHLETILDQRTLTAFDESDAEKTLRVGLTVGALAAGNLVPVIIYSPLEQAAFRHGTPYAN